MSNTMYIRKMLCLIVFELALLLVLLSGMCVRLCTDNSTSSEIVAVTTEISQTEPAAPHETETFADAPSTDLTEPTVEETSETQEVEPPHLVVYKLTAYCPCLYCCGNTDGITASGIKATAGRTIAVDPSVIPYGTEVVINGHTYIAEDCGGAVKGNTIDIFFDTHQEAVLFGVQFAEVEIMR